MAALTERRCWQLQKTKINNKIHIYISKPMTTLSSSPKPMLYLPRYRQLPPNFRPPLHPCFILITHTRWGSSPSCGASDPPPGARLPVTSLEDFPVASHCCLTTGWFLKDRKIFPCRAVILVSLLNKQHNRTRKLYTWKCFLCDFISKGCITFIFYRIFRGFFWFFLPYIFLLIQFTSINWCELYVFTDCHIHFGFFSL